MVENDQKSAGKKGKSVAMFEDLSILQIASLITAVAVVVAFAAGIAAAGLTDHFLDRR